MTDTILTDARVDKILTGDFEAPVECQNTAANGIAADIRQKVWALMALGYSPQQISELRGMPCFSTIYKWRRHPELSKEYLAAEELQIEQIYARLVKFTDQSNYERVINQGDGKVTSHTAAVSAHNVAINTSKWVLERKDPARFGDAVSRPVQFEFNASLAAAEQILSVIRQASIGELTLNNANTIIDMIVKHIEVCELPKIIEMVKQHEILLRSGNQADGMKRFRLSLSEEPLKAQ